MGAARRSVHLLVAFVLGIELCGATSPWRIHHGQMHEVFQRPTFRPRTTTTTTTSTRNSLDSLNSVMNTSNSGPTPTQAKTYKTFYRVFYGTPPPGPEIPKTNQPMASSPKPLQRRTQDKPNTELEDIREANRHFLHVRTQYRCGVPAPRVLKVREFYPDPSREYLPRCAVLHRCTDDVGCCENDALHCVPRTIQEVTLAFYVLSINPDHPSLSSSLEKLLFENHTECHCELIYDLPRSGNSNSFHSNKVSTTVATTTTTTTTTAVPTTMATSKPVAIEENSWRTSKCQECPVPFHRRDYSDGRCSCDCFDRDKPCLKVKKGKEALDEVERRCVEVAHCHIPECEYGPYDYDSGRCPKKPDNYRRTVDAKGHISPHHRWNFLERD